MFKDKVYDELDDISKLIEPYQYSVNEDISRMPDRIEVDPSTLFFSRTPSIRDVLYCKCEELGLRSLQNNLWDVCHRASFFEFEFIDNQGEVVPSLTYNFSTGEIDGKVVVVKKNAGFNDDEVIKIASEKAQSQVERINWRDASASRLNEVADLLSITTPLKEKSCRRKVLYLASGLKEVIKSKKIDIRDVSLIEKLAKWIRLYVEDGNLPALANIAKIKIMSHQNKPIYSIQEQETV